MTGLLSAMDCLRLGKTVIQGEENSENFIVKNNLDIVGETTFHNLSNEQLKPVTITEIYNTVKENKANISDLENLIEQNKCKCNGNQGNVNQGGNEGGNEGGNQGGNEGNVNQGGNQGGNEGGNQGGNEGGNQNNNQISTQITEINSKIDDITDKNDEQDATIGKNAQDIETINDTLDNKLNNVTKFSTAFIFLGEIKNIFLYLIYLNSILLLTVKEVKKYLQMASDLVSKNATNYLKKFEDER